MRWPTLWPLCSRRTAALGGLLTLVIAGLVCPAPVQSAQPAGSPDRMIHASRSLFDWEGDPNCWRMEDSVIVGEIKPGTTLNKNTWLVWRGEELSDFDLRLQFRLTGLPGANSGIQFRCQVDNYDHVSGYQADLDTGDEWLGRIYDEHGRALLVERGTRVRIDADGRRHSEEFAPASQYRVLFRENDWNDYRIVAVGPRISVYVNGTLFSELQDEQTGERDLSGRLALQLHSGPQTKVEFRDIVIRPLKADDQQLAPLTFRDPEPADSSANTSFAPTDAAGRELNFGFESGSLDDWTATGDAFRQQPVAEDGIAQRWAAQTSAKQGRFFIGGYELAGDEAVGTLTSQPFQVSHPYASFLFAGGPAPGTRLELVQPSEGDAPTVVFSAGGRQTEQMERFAVDLRPYQGQSLVIRLVDENSGGWGHLNFDDFRLHDSPPVPVLGSSMQRSTHNPVLQHLQPVGSDVAALGPASDTVAKMFAPAGFAVDVIAAEPDLHQPMAFTFDARGRLWVVEGNCYPQKRPEGEGLDRILIFADNDHDGTFETRSVFADGLNLVSGLEVGHGGVWVGAAPELLYIPDLNGDDLPDGPPQVLLDGFGYADTHETLNSFLWGPDGWLYGNQGVFNTSRIGQPGTHDSGRIPLSAGVWRYHPTRHQFEVFAAGGSNQWGLDYDQFGQVFMTHCRSFWGRGGTTHVMQGGHYWNQTNAGHAAFISRTALPGRPWLTNYLLASARYDHGAGGAGKPGTDEVYGGHSHVGTMIYQGDNWPAEYRHHLFTHNLHGHQINQQINLREAGGFNTVHAGQDLFFCADPRYIGVDLQYGPDGAVYISDWYDPRHCHNPNAEEWDRGNGRIYRLKYASTWQPAAVDYVHATDEELVAAQRHPNEWHVRTARMVLSERASQKPLDPKVTNALRAMALRDTDAAQQLRGLWTLSCVGAFTPDDALSLLETHGNHLHEPSQEYLRAWAIQLAVEALREQPDGGAWHDAAPRLYGQLKSLADLDHSLFVARYLASAIQRVPPAVGWTLAETLVDRADLASDRDLPLLLWQSIAPLTLTDVDRALRLADISRIPAVSDNITWYVAANSLPARERIVQTLIQQRREERVPLLSLLNHAALNQPGLAAPSNWQQLASELYHDLDPQVVQLAESIGIAFQDEAAFARVRQSIAEGHVSGDALRSAIEQLANDPSPANLPLFVKLLDTPEVAAIVIPRLAKFNEPAVADELLARLAHWPPRENAAAMEVLCGRVAWAQRLLDALAEGTLPKSQLTAFHVTLMSNLGDQALSERIKREWGEFRLSSDEAKAKIAKLVKTYQAAPLWAYSKEAGAGHFQKLCAGCHLPNGSQPALAPLLAGSGAKGIEYFVENIVDPNAVIGKDFQARVIETTEGRVMTGLLTDENATSVTIRTQQGQTVIPRADIEELRVSPNSLMPEGALKNLSTREQIELFSYLMGL